MVCEWMVAKVKNWFKTLGGNFTEETIDKKSKATALVSSILEQDSRNLLVDSTTPGHSLERFDVEEIKRFKEYVLKLKPCRCEQNIKKCTCTIICKARPEERSSVSGQIYSQISLLVSKLEKFFNMKIKNMI